MEDLNFKSHEVLNKQTCDTDWCTSAPVSGSQHITSAACYVSQSSNLPLQTWTTTHTSFRLLSLLNVCDVTKLPRSSWRSWWNAERRRLNRDLAVVIATTHKVSQDNIFACFCSQNPAIKTNFSKLCDAVSPADLSPWKTHSHHLSHEKIHYKWDTCLSKGEKLCVCVVNSHRQWQFGHTLEVMWHGPSVPSCHHDRNKQCLCNSRCTQQLKKIKAILSHDLTPTPFHRLPGLSCL